MKKSRFASIRRALGRSFSVVAMTLAGCDSEPSMAPDMVGPLAGMPLASLRTAFG